MREILFRGKRVDNGQWIYGYYIKATHHWHKNGIHEDWIATDTTQNGGWCNVRGKYAVIPDTIGQYTGLTDKNGNKIFEGDIHEIFIDGDRHLFVIKHGKYYDFEISDERYGLYFQNIETDDCNSFYGNEKDYANIIGNIYDNPELLRTPQNDEVRE